MSEELREDFQPTYENIKALAKRNKLKVGELLALDSTNDPFYFGRPAQVAKAGWFAAMWEEQGYTRGKHIRRIHYDLIGEEAEEGEGGDYLKHDGSPICTTTTPATISTRRRRQPDTWGAWPRTCSRTCA